MTVPVSPEDIDRSPPHDLEAEASVLGSMIIDNECIRPILQVLTAGDFYGEGYGRIFAAAVRLHEDAQAVDAVLLREELRRRGDLELVGGPETLVNLLDIVPTAAHAVHYAGIVREHSVRRDLLIESGRLADAARNGMPPAEAAAVGAARLQALSLSLRGAEDEAVPLSKVDPKAVRWLWPGRLAFSTFAMLEGDPGLGKSSIALEIAARYTTGRPMPDGSGGGPPGIVLYLSTEDPPAEVIRPRLEAAGGDPSRVFIMKVMPAMPEDLARLERVLVKYQGTLAFLDPLSGFFGGGIDSWNDADTRRALSPLAEVCVRTGAIACGIRHHNKAGGTNPLYRGGGSIAITAAARSVLMVTADAEEAGVSILSVAKSSFARLAPSLRYRLVERTKVIGGTPCEVSGVEWLGQDPRQAHELLATAESAAKTARRVARDEAAQERVLGVVHKFPGLKRDEVIARAGRSRAENGCALKLLVEEQELFCTGKGGKKDPHRYWPDPNPSQPVRTGKPHGEDGDGGGTRPPSPGIGTAGRAGRDGRVRPGEEGGTGSTLPFREPPPGPSESDHGEGKP